MRPGPLIALPLSCATTSRRKGAFVPGSVVSSQTGKPILANDPHLRYIMPNLWYLARVTSLESESAAGTDPEAVHQLRVALRRFRCIVRILEHIGEESALPRMHRARDPC